MTWFIPSRERPHRLRQLINACHATKMSTSAVVLIDDDDPCLSGYMNLSLIPYWNIEVSSGGGLSEIYNGAFARHPHEEWYGILCDDVIPETEYFDVKLIEAAGKDGIAVPTGGHHPDIAPHFVIGGDLVREIGWVSLPGLDRIYIDTVWNDIAKNRGVFRQTDVVLKHMHFSNGGALMDKTYRKHNKENDRKLYNQWHDKYEISK